MFPNTLVRQARETPARTSSAERRALGASECGPLILTLHLPHFPSPPHTASIWMPAARQASSTAAPFSTRTDFPSGSKTTLWPPLPAPPATRNQLVVNGLHGY